VAGEVRPGHRQKHPQDRSDQTMTADKLRLKSRIDELSEADMLAVAHAMRVQLALTK
jgi:mRNA-degrading endonuclease toxin of MazEF toxin-antitoxin module